MGKLLAVIGGGLAVVILTSPLLLALVVAAALAPAAQVHQTIACNGTLASTGEWRVPFVDAAYQVTSGYGYRYNPISGASELHDGTDLAAPQTTVVAASSGRVDFAGWGDGFGYHVVIDHGAGITTLYGHLDSIDAAITAGAPVAIGQPVGVEGSTGWSTGIHLHFTIKQDGTAIDPVPFMLEHGAPLNGQPAGPSNTSSPAAGVLEGGVGFELPEPEIRQDSLHNPPLPIPDRVQRLYQAAAARYGLPWTLLAGVGMAETAHGRNTATSSAGAQGLMQFMPATWAAYGVDGDNDGRADINNEPTASTPPRTTSSPPAPRRARRRQTSRVRLQPRRLVRRRRPVLRPLLRRWAGPRRHQRLPARERHRRPDPAATHAERLQAVLGWAQGRLGLPYRMGANGPDAYDCSSFTQAAYAQIGVTMPRTAEEQRNWLAAGNGYRVSPGQERPGDLIFIDSYLGPQPDRPRRPRLGPRNPADHRGGQQRTGGHPRQLHRLGEPDHLRDMAGRQRRRQRLSQLPPRRWPALTRVNTRSRPGLSTLTTCSDEEVLKPDLHKTSVHQ